MLFSSQVVGQHVRASRMACPLYCAPQRVYKGKHVFLKCCFTECFGTVGSVVHTFSLLYITSAGL